MQNKHLEMYEDDGLLTGLTNAQVSASLKEYGDNALHQKKRQGFFSKLLEGFGDPIIKILIAALCINLLFVFKGEGWFEAAGLAIAIFIAVFVSTLSEYGSESAFLRLSREAGKSRCRVRRNGKTTELAIDELVCGDIVLLSAGEGVPADGQIISGSVSVDQSALNGESKEKEKYPSDVDEKGWDLQSHEKLFRGSVITSGDCVMHVIRIGDATFFGGMAGSLLEETRDSPLKLRLSNFAKSISKIGYLAAMLIATADLFNKLFIENSFSMPLIMAELNNFQLMVQNLLHAATLAMGVIIMAVPEGLPMMITVVMSSSMFRMLKDKVMVRKLTGIETAGSVDLLFTDKTGTITTGKLAVTEVITGTGDAYSAAGDIKKTSSLAELIHMCGSVCTSASITEKGAVGGNATDRALALFTDEMALMPAQRLAYIPFDSRRKFAAAKVSSPRGEQILVKGAPEALLERCSTCVDDDGAIRRFADRSKITGSIHAASRRGERVICLCLAPSMPDGDTLPLGMSFIAAVVIKDSLRQEARGAIDRLNQAGIQVSMITGDSPDTAYAIAKEAGIIQSSGDIVLTSGELATMTDLEISRLLPRIKVIARSLPTDKSRLVRIAQDSGRVVAMTGDGINDAPALRLADVGFSMGSGTQVAKDAGDIVITDDNISSIGNAVLYGRTIFKSIQKFITFQMTTNMAAVGISLIAPFVGIDTPVTVVQMLWINIIMDTLAGIAFSGEPALAEYMREKPKKRDTPILTQAMARNIAAGSVFTLLCGMFFLTSDWVKNMFSSQEAHLTGFFTLFVFSSVAFSFCARSGRINHFSNLRRNPAFVIVMSCVAVVQILLVFFGGPLFRTVPITGRQMIFCALLAACHIPVDIVRKLIGRKINSIAINERIKRASYIDVK